MESLAVLTIEQVRAIVADAVRQELQSILPTIVRQATTKPYLTKTELAEMTGWSTRKIDYMKAKQTIPFIQRGRKVLFPTDEIHAFLAEGYVPARERKRDRRW